VPARSVEALQQYLGRLCDRAMPPEDAVLLNRFVEANDRDAFEMLVARHGPMVLGAARRLVDEPHDAEDVFQAVFLSLARLAKSIRHGRTLPAWLHRATGRIAAKVRAKRPDRSRAVPEGVEQRDPGAGLHWQEIRQALDEELGRLPEQLRTPLLLCYLSGLSRDEAATQLGWSLGTLKRRLEEGRKMLRSRLERRGIASAGLALAVLTPQALQATVREPLLDASLAMIFATKTVAPSTISELVLGAATMKSPAMKSIFAILAVVGAGVGLYAGAGQADPPKKAEEPRAAVHVAEPDQVARMDDPLPAGAALRFGNSRYRHGIAIKTLAISRDGKTAFATNDNGPPRAFDLATGRVLFSPNWGSVEAGVYSPDGRTLVLKSGFDLHVFDAATGKDLRTIKGAHKNLRATGTPVFTPDGKAIATVSDGKDVHLIDFESGNLIRDFVHEKLRDGSPSDFSQVNAIGFSPDGRLMATGGYANEKGNYFARLFEVETGKELHRFEHGPKGYGIGSLTFSPDGKTLATLGTQGGVFLRLFDVGSGKERRAFPKDGELRPCPGSVAFSPDGKTVAAALTSIHLYDTATGEERLRIDRRASVLQFTDDGKTLTGGVSGAIYRWDTTTGKMLTPEAADSGVGQILVSADGSRVITRGQDSDGYIWDGVTGRLLRRIPVAYYRGLAISPDGRFLAWPVSDDRVTFTEPPTAGSRYSGTRIRLYDLATDRVVDRFPTFKGSAQDLAFTSDGKKLVTVDQHGGMVRTWDYEAGKEVQSFSIVKADMKEKSFVVSKTQLSQDGKTAAVTYVEQSGVDRLGMRGPPQHLRLWDVATGKQLPEPAVGSPVDRAFSPDGRYVVTAGGNFVYEVATGRQVSSLSHDSYIRAAAFSRDGRYLATAVHEGLIQIWEVATWTKRYEFKGHDNRSVTLTFGPGGRLFAGNQDTTVLVWPMRTPPADKSVSLESAWTSLATWGSAESFKAEGRFRTVPAETVKVFAERIKPVQALDPKRIERLLADLGSDVFAVREAASTALVALDGQAVPHLEATLRTTASAEVRERVERILEQKRTVAISSDQLRQIRAVMVLELIGDGESKNLLKRWADGPAGALLTIEASAAVERLEAGSTGKR
jgi:RNA polymerase sigma factor (sigma-70 family)